MQRANDFAVDDLTLVERRADVRAFVGEAAASAFLVNADQDFLARCISRVEAVRRELSFSDGYPFLFDSDRFGRQSHIAVELPLRLLLDGFVLYVQ